MKKQKIFIVHGWTYSLNRWEIMLTELERLGFNPIMLNVPGLSVPSDSAWDIPKYVEWLRGSIKDEKNPLVVGHSNGGRIAMAYDVAYPNHIQHLFLIASAGIHHDNRSLGLKRVVFRGIAKLLRPVVRGRVRHILYRAIGATDYGNATENMRESITNVLEYDKTFDPSKVSARTSLIWGAEDQATPLEDARILEQKVQNFNDIIVFQGVKHSPHADVPKEVAQFIQTRSMENDRTMAVFNSLGSNYRMKHLGAMIFGFNPMAKLQLHQFLEERYGAEAVLTYKGREALFLGLTKQNLKPGSAVAINGYTCFAVYDAVVSAGLTPVYVDIKKGELNFSARQLDAAIKKHPEITAVIVQNTLGTPADMQAIQKICDKKKLYLLEDLAHSIGMFYEDGREAGSVADSALSFSQDKVVDGVSGGAFLYRDDTKFSPKTKRLGYLKFLKDYYYIFNTMFIRSGYTWGGGKFYNWFLRKLKLLPRPMDGSASQVRRPDIWHINLILSQFKDLDDTIEHRRSIGDVYRQNLPKKVQLTHFNRSTDLRFPLQVADPSSLIKHLKKSGIFISDTWYESPVSPIRSLAKTNYKAGMCPNSEDVAAQMVNLPTHINVDEKTAELITEKVNQWLTEQEK